MRPLIVSLRPQEWVKNVLVFAGIVFSRSFDEPGAVADVLVTFVAFCAVSSAGYLFNDLRDVEHDRRHPDKRNRPIASGAVSEGTAGAVAVVLAALAIVAPLVLVSAEVAAIVAIYAAATVLYSIVLKRLVIIDVMTIAGLFLLRVYAGAEAVDVGTSEFLLVCTAMLALFLGFTKRRQEAILEELPAAPSAAGGAEPPVTRPVLEHYSLPFLDQMIAMVTATALISYIIYAVDSPFAGSKMLATAPSVLYGVFRYLYLIYDRQDTRSTAAIIAKDPGVIFAGVTYVASAIFVLYVLD
ncbi:MAG TPA: decaprenyl-phosphate phosphoribosyltransferase [Solirubrobacterales bacterium]|nr:decaprenyl-phosphate phosphoribosyltransferase [Solirubrobacterales bacterium]